MDDFLAAVDTRQGIRIIIDGSPVYVTRRRLLAHLHLSRLELKLYDTRHPVEISALILEYLQLAGLSDDHLRKASVYELLEAFFALRRLNAWQWVLPWLKEPPGNRHPQPDEPYNYSNRRWAIWVHKIASRYNWPPGEIWNLWPEEAAAYLQEIMLSEYYEREDERALSKVSYDYDKVSQTYRFRPAPMYHWMVDNKPPPPVRIPRRALPVGNVVKLSE